VYSSVLFGVLFGTLRYSSVLFGTQGATMA
jgi:hypothetical protein